eukprot:2885226-Prymnesium_polylepis.1
MADSISERRCRRNPARADLAPAYLQHVVGGSSPASVGRGCARAPSLAASTLEKSFNGWSLPGDRGA